MKRFTIAVLLAVFIIGCRGEVAPSSSSAEAARAARMQEQQNEVTRLIALLSLEETTVEERIIAEQRLSELPPEIVLAAHYPEFDYGMPRIRMYNGSDAEGERDAPVAWRVFYSYLRVRQAAEIRQTQVREAPLVD